jgi:hypothetical protein
MEDVAEILHAVSLAPLGSEDRVPRFDNSLQAMLRNGEGRYLGIEKAHNELSLGTNSEDKGPAGNQDFEAPGICSTSAFGTRPGMDVTQAATHNGVGDPVRDPQLEPAEFNFRAAGLTHSPAGLFGGRYPDRKKKHSSAN